MDGQAGSDRFGQGRNPKILHDNCVYSGVGTRAQRAFHIVQFVIEREHVHGHVALHAPAVQLLHHARQVFDGEVGGAGAGVVAADAEVHSVSTTADRGTHRRFIASRSKDFGTNNHHSRVANVVGDKRGNAVGPLSSRSQNGSLPIVDHRHRCHVYRDDHHRRKTIDVATPRDDIVVAAEDTDVTLARRPICGTVSPMHKTSISIPLLCLLLISACEPACGVDNVNDVDDAYTVCLANGGCPSDRECEDGEICTARVDGCGVCVQYVCAGEQDCADDEHCDLARERCEPDDACSLQDGGGCEAGVCGPVDDGDSCVIPVVASCEVVPAVVLAVDGQRPAFTVLALDDAGRPVPATSTLSLPAALADGTAHCTAAEACHDVVTAAIGADVSCTADVIVLPALSAQRMRVVVRDIDTGAAVPGAAVVIDGVTATADSDGIVVFEAESIGWVRAAAAGFESVTVTAPGAVDVELLLPRTAGSGLSAGKLVEPNLALPEGPGNVVIGLSTLSTPDLIGALTGTTLLGVPFELRIAEAVVITQASGMTGSLNNEIVAPLGVARGRPGTRLLSHLGTRTSQAAVLLAALQNNEGVYGAARAEWDLASSGALFDVVGTVETTNAAGTDPLAFDDGNRARPRAAIEPTAEVDVAVPALPQHATIRDDSAFVALYANIPGRGFMLLALRFVDDTDADGLVDAGRAPGVVRLSVAPSLWTVDRDLVVVAGSQRKSDFIAGVLAENRVTARVASDRVELPAFKTAAATDVVGSVVTVGTRDAGTLLVIQGDNNGAPFRVLVGGDATSVDLAEFGIAGTVSKVWQVEAAPTFAAGSLDVATSLAAPTRAVVR
jgi:hypothetical protein